MPQPTKFMHEMRELAPNDHERAESLRMGRRLAANLREGKVPAVIVRLMTRPWLIAALLEDALAGNIPDDPRPRIRTPRASDKKQPTKRRRHPKQSTVRL